MLLDFVAYVIEPRPMEHSKILWHRVSRIIVFMASKEAMEYWYIIEVSEGSLFVVNGNKELISNLSDTNISDRDELLKRVDSSLLMLCRNSEVDFT